MSQDYVDPVFGPLTVVVNGVSAPLDHDAAGQASATFPPLVAIRPLTPTTDLTARPGRRSALTGKYVVNGEDPK